MNARGLQIHHPSELNSLLVSRLFRRPGRGAIRLSPDFQHQEKAQWEAALNRYYYACGCASSAKGLLLMLVFGLGASLAAYAFDTLSLKAILLLPLGAALIGAVAGKLIGLATAHQRLSRVVHTVQAAWKPERRTQRPVVSCG